MTVTITHHGETRTTTEAEWQATLDDMVSRLGPWVAGESKVEREPESTPERRNSDFGDGEQIVDGDARERIESTHVALGAAGVKVDSSRQLYATGTRMADSGYARQAERAREHAAKLPIKDAAAMLVEQIRAERRRDVEVTAGELGKALGINGALRFDGLKLREQAVRGMLGRLTSPALSGPRREYLPGNQAASRRRSCLARSCRLV